MGSFFDDVIKVSPLFGSAQCVDSMDLLHPVMKRKVEAIIADAASHGLKLMAYETYRSQQRQQALFDQGATKLKNVGVHHYGLACDIVKSINGEPSWKGSFDLLAELARNHQLIWGGDWGRPGVHHSFVDEPHVQWCSLKDQTKLFNGSWYPEEGYNPYDHM